MILVSGLEVGEPVPPGCWVVSSLDEAVESVSSVRGDSLLVCTRTEASRPSVMTREVIARDDLAMVVIQGPPTRQALVLRALSMLPPTSYGLAQHVADTVGARCWTRVALSSVSRLSQARPGLGQHIRSFFPGASFDVDLNSGKVRSSSSIIWDTNGARVICWASGADKAAMKVSVTGGTPHVVLSPTGASPYGARRWAELSVVEDLRASVGFALSSVQAVACSSCGRLTPRTGCPFCGTWKASVSKPHSYSMAERHVS